MRTVKVVTLFLFAQMTTLKLLCDIIEYSKDKYNLFKYVIWDRHQKKINNAPEMIGFVFLPP